MTKGQKRKKDYAKIKRMARDKEVWIKWVPGTCPKRADYYEEEFAQSL